MRLLPVALLLAAAANAAADDLVLAKALAIPQPGAARRELLRSDAVEKLVVAGQWRAPRAGDVVRLPSGDPPAWRVLEANAEGQLWADDLGGGYVSWQLELPEARTLLLDATGHAMAYVNGEPRTGDPYHMGWTLLPVRLRAGANEILFRLTRPLKARLVEPKSEALLNARDVTRPDLVAHRALEAPASVVVVNATERWLEGLSLVSRVGDGPELSAAVPRLAPLSVRKVAFALEGLAPADAEKAVLTMTLRRADVTLDSATLDLDVRLPWEAQRVTFTSALDGSVQYYGRLHRWPWGVGGEDGGRPALILSLHGAGVEAIGQAASHAPKSWAAVVAPTNRRPYGFDWEDWGRLDALEVLALAHADLRTDPLRTYVLGHSMGGHGTWQLASTYPFLFAAAGPSAGWASFWTYQGVERATGETPAGRLLQRASNPSNTPLLASNLGSMGVYVLHGDADDNVPVREAREQRARLAPWHRDLRWHEQAGAGHWWDASPEVAGTDCVDWPAMLDHFAGRARATAPRRASFVTMSPAVSSTFPLGEVWAQQRALEPSRVDVARSTDGRRITGTTENVARLRLAFEDEHFAGAVAVELDGTKLEIDKADGETELLLERGAAGWRRVDAFPPGDKSPLRGGALKEAFFRGPLLVVGTRGAPEEDAWALAKARFDAETFWYRGNGLLEIVTDAELDASLDRDRHVVLYGNADTNSAWRALLGDSPVQVRRGSVRVGATTLSGSDLACLFVRPRPGSDVGLVAAIAGTGAVGQRLCDRVPLFVSGIHLPDVTVLSPDSLSLGERGLLAAGWFANDWSMQGADIEVGAR